MFAGSCFQKSAPAGQETSGMGVLAQCFPDPRGNATWRPAIENVRSRAPRGAFSEILASTGCGTHSSLLVDRISTIAHGGEGRRGRVEVGGFQVEPGFPRSSYGSFAGPGLPIGGRGAAKIGGGVPVPSVQRRFSLCSDPTVRSCRLKLTTTRVVSY